ncbi:MAG: hypothetical protein GX336_03065 [Halanaerobiaceae bacterium]|nr:hypothetical protein [Halanaerobiaceae bacterium]
MPDVKKILGKEDGLTLVELLTVIGIMGLMVIAFYSLVTFSPTGHNQAQNIAQRQSDFNLIQTYFKNELANAIEIHMLDSLPDPLDNNYNYIYLDNGSLILREGTTTRAIVENRVDNLLFSLEEASSTNHNSLYKYILVYTVNDIESSLILNNINYDISDNHKTIIAYRKP